MRMRRNADKYQLQLSLDCDQMMSERDDWCFSTWFKGQEDRDAAGRHDLTVTLIADAASPVLN